MKWLSRILIVVGIGFLIAFGYTVYDHMTSSSVTLEEAQVALEQKREELASSGTVQASEEEEYDASGYSAEYGEAFGVLEIPKLKRSIGIVEGTDADSLKRGVGHVSSTAYPGQDEQIVLSGHRDTVFRDFGELQVGDTFVVQMSYGDYEYEIQDHTIVDKYDTSIIGNMGEEVLVVSTCYPFEFYGFAPDRFVFFCYPVS